MNRYSSLPRSSKPLRRTRLRQSSGSKPCPPKKPVVRLAGQEMTELRWAAFERSGGFCEAQVTTGRAVSRCMAPLNWHTFHLAHILHRGKGGEDVLGNVLCKCVACHMGPATADHPGPQWSRRSA